MAYGAVSSLELTIERLLNSSNIPILKWKVCESLSELRYLIVLDDVWYTDLCYEFANVFPDDKNGSVALLTTRLTEVSKCVHPLNSHRLPFLDKKESWELLRHKVFDAMPCPRELEKSGKKIAENCEGLPLTIVTVAHILSKTDKTSVYWNQVANDKQNSVYKDAYDQMSNVLYPSYDYLPQHLKACFLYLGAFPQDYMVWRRQLIDLWSAEGFLNRKSTMTSTDYTFAYVGALLSNNVIIYNEEKFIYHLHSSFWYLCNKEATKNKFFYAFNCLADALPKEGINYQLRRLCIRNNVLLAIEDAHDSIASASTVRSLLCTGPYHQYPVPFCLEQLRLLRVLEALSIKSYEFPMEVLKLLQLRYLALTYDGNLPTFISKLFNLQYLIVHHQYRIVKSVGNPYYLPIEIWNMKELKSLEIRGRDLPHPCEGSLLSNLTTLTGVGPQSCTKDVLEKIPNLKELTIQIELVPVASKPFSCFDHIYNLHQLQELECEITNPIFKAQTWYCNAMPFEARSGRFMTTNSKSFQIEDTDLVHWKFVTTNFCFPAIKVLGIEHCYKLKEISLTFGTSLENIYLVDCNPMVVNWANSLKGEWDDKYGGHGRRLYVIVRYSLYCTDGNTRILILEKFGNETAGVKFCMDPNNLYNLHSFKHSIKAELHSHIYLY
ncbi:PREDICTED: putative late blight resistance protein homolog R1A-10 [Erythranthe guttata]|uniref:putative late blight resistance protein homolog R1A-10 n=1 Tax=Erythranthe guttata TaxID=4155 RepID=UPI00064DF192|nr:PREDICTED: putative late blight resistance protein homolog R1A-10 [Erythranthe guttata]|eukprot:XP_012829203.1 PREDICTED: putative late blight resistance protein homolog R1A-10 [Erythranthe guttata]